MIYLRKASGDEDIKRISKLAEIIWHEHYTDIIGKDQVLYMLENFQSESKITDSIINDGYIYYMAFDGDKDSSNCIAYLGAKADSDSVFLSKIYVHKDWRNQGIAKSLLDFVSYDFSDKEFMHLTVNKENTLAITVYEKLGFIRTDSIKTDIGNGFIMDDYVYRIGMRDYLLNKCKH